MVSRTRSVRRTFYIRRSPAAVYRAITDPAQLARWFCERAEIALHRGGAYRFIIAGGWEHTGTIARIVPGKSITLRWAWEGVPLHNTLFRLSVRPSGRGTLLTVVHTGFPRAESWVGLYGVSEWGWTYYAMNLKSVLETGHDLRSLQDR